MNVRCFFESLNVGTFKQEKMIITTANNIGVANNTDKSSRNMIIIGGESDSGYLGPLFDDAYSGNYRYYTTGDFLKDVDNLLSEVDVVLLDIDRNSGDTFSLLPIINIIKLYDANLPVVVISDATVYENIKKAFELGASGYLLKREPLTEIYEQVIACADNKRVAISHEVLISLVRKNEGGRYQESDCLKVFTEREKSLISYLEKGLTQKEIGSSMNISAATVNQHLKHIYQKMNVRSKTELFYKMFN